MAKRIHFGVAEIGYAYGKQARTTHEVGEFLEKKYQLIERFVKHKEGEIRNEVRAQAQAHASRIIAGRDPTFAPLSSKIQRMFKDFILTKGPERIGIPGTPTLAALRGVNHRKKRPYAKSNAPRQSFYDTGLYVSAFRVWVE